MARSNLRNAGVLSRVQIRLGRALDSLSKLARSGAKPFDLIFIDADRENNPQYLEWALKLSRPGTVIVIDNVDRQGTVIEARSADPRCRAPAAAWK